MLLKQRQSQSSLYLSLIPEAYVTDPRVGSTDEGDLNDAQKDEHMNYFVDRLICEEIDERESLIDLISFHSSDEGYPSFTIPITGRSMERVISLACGDFYLPQELVDDFDGDGHSMICTMTSFLAFMQLGKCTQ